MSEIIFLFQPVNRQKADDDSDQTGDAERPRMIFEGQIDIHAPEPCHDGRDSQDDGDRSQNFHDIVQVICNHARKYFAQLIDHLA